jgi:hypothetical protein
LPLMPRAAGRDVSPVPSQHGETDVRTRWSSSRTGPRATMAESAWKTVCPRPWTRRWGHVAASGRRGAYGGSVVPLSGRVLRVSPRVGGCALRVH